MADGEAKQFADWCGPEKHVSLTLNPFTQVVISHEPHATALGRRGWKQLAAAGVESSDSVIALQRGHAAKAKAYVASVKETAGPHRVSEGSVVVFDVEIGG